MAALSASYDDSMSRVLLSATSLPSTADVALFEVSTDNIHWTTVRGGSAVTITSNTASLYDNEFAAGVTNYYRVSAVDVALPTFVASSTAVSAVNTSVTPTLPSGWAEGDLLVIWAAVRNSGAGAIVAPTGWTVMLQVDNIALLGRRATSSESNPTVTISGGVSGADVIAHMAAFRNAERTPAATAYQLNPSAQNITYPPMAGVESNWGAALYLGWKQDDWTSVATLASATAEIGEPVSTAGNDAGLVWDYQLMSTPVATAQGAFTVTGGASAISYGAQVILRTADYVNRATTSITPDMKCPWVKVVAAPYLNRQVTVIDWGAIERTSRVGVYTVVMKRDAIAATDTAVPKTVTVSLWSASDAEFAALDLVFRLGQVVLLHMPGSIALKSMYAAIGTYQFVRPAHRSHRGTLTIPLTEVAQPDLSIVGNMVTWATLITNYSTWNDVVNANATWSAVLALQGTPPDALVGT